jgi:hypothetical protein
VFVGGRADAALPGQSAAGTSDGFVRKYLPDGSVGWTKQFGSSLQEEVTSVATDLGGNVYAAGTAWGGFTGVEDLGFSTAYVFKFPPQ